MPKNFAGYTGEGDWTIVISSFFMSLAVHGSEYHTKEYLKRDELVHNLLEVMFEEIPKWFWESVSGTWF